MRLHSSGVSIMFLIYLSWERCLTFDKGAYYLPLYFQVMGSSATNAGVK